MSSTAGFQNSHVHFTEDALERRGAQAPPAALAQAARGRCSRGTASPRCSTRARTRRTPSLCARASRKAKLPGPRILTVGLPLYPPDGIPVYIRDLAARGAGAHAPAAKRRRGARGRCAQNLAAGADGTKLFLHTSPDGEIQRKHVARSRARRRRRNARARQSWCLRIRRALDGIRLALDSGVDILVHTTLGETAPWDATLIEQMKAKHMSVIPTFKLWIYELNKAERAAADRRKAGRRHARGTARLRRGGRPDPVWHRRRIHARIRPHRRNTHSWRRPA